MTKLADMVRDVPEVATRLYLGAKAEQHDDGIRIELDGQDRIVSQGVYLKAQEIVRVLSIRTRRMDYASDILNLRHEAEEHFLEDLFAGGGNLPKILFVPAGTLMASAYYRAMIPADTMTDRGKALAHYTERLDLGKAARYDILWIQLVASPVLTEIARQAQKHGIKVIYDIDDRFDVAPPENPAMELYLDKAKDVWEIIELADLVTVSTKPLGDYIQSRAKAVKVLPNYIPAIIWPNSAPPDSRFTRILWAGSPTHKRDLAIVSPALRKILERHKGKVRFACMGEHIPEALDPAREYVDLIPTCGFEEYPEMLGSIGANFAIAPLEQHPFNESKSALKFLEYSACGYHTLMSPAAEYPDIEFEKKSIVADDEWENALEWAIAHPEEVKTTGLEARTWVRHNRCIVKSWAKLWLDTAHEILKMDAVAKT